MKQTVRMLGAILNLHLLAGVQGAETITSPAKSEPASTAETIPLHAGASDRVLAWPEYVITTPGVYDCVTPGAAGKMVQFIHVNARAFCSPLKMDPAIRQVHLLLRK